MIRDFLKLEASGGILLVGCAVLAMIIANSPLLANRNRSAGPLSGPNPALQRPGPARWRPDDGRRRRRMLRVRT